jgi:ribonuclease Z
VPLKHRIPCFGYVIQESDKPGKLDVEKAKSLGVKHGPDLGILKNGNSVIAVGTGQEIKPEDVLGEPIKGKKVVVLGDTCDTTEIAVFSQDADYIVHEATMEDSLKSKGRLISEENFLGFKSLKKANQIF